MRNIHKALTSAGISLFLLAALAHYVAAQGFNEQFSSPSLDPAWQVVQFTGTRVYGYTSPANHFSLSDNPGQLRYILDPMTHGDGFAYGFQTSYGLHSCCNHDPGLELRRAFSGENWLFAAKADYYLPYTNGRNFALNVYFGEGGIGTYSVQFLRGRDVNQNYLRIILAERTGADPWNYPLIEDVSNGFSIFGGPDFFTLHFQLMRAAGVLTALWSTDGINWNTAFSHDMGTQLNGLNQRVVISGLSWFNTGGSYADYDYVSVTPTTIAVGIDISPGTFPNSINPGSNGVIPVAILTTPTFNAATVNSSTVRFGANGTETAPVQTALQDVDGDGDVDRILHFRTQRTGITCGATSASLTGKTFNGQTIQGTDSIVTVSCN